MAEWFARAFDATWEEASRGFADIRRKLMAGWFGRDPDMRGTGDLGWSIEGKDAPATHEPDMRLLDRLFDASPEHCAPEPDAPGHEPDHGIDR